MNRHHPYGGTTYDTGRRGGGSPSGPGPDRGHRFERGGAPRGRGYGRGRGGGGSYGSYDANSGSGAYDQVPPQGDMGGFNSYDSAPSQDTFYQNGSYGSAASGQFGGAPDASEDYNQGYGNGNYEDGTGYGQEDFGARPPKRQRRERDDKVHDSIIEERIQRERPCRTLFIRNIKYETDSTDVRHKFEEHGDIKTFFDLISNRGMVFVTYYDLRAAERARDRLQGSEISGRPIDVHYSLPRDDSGKDSEKTQELQGSLLVTLRNSVTGQSIDDNEVRRKFQQFGDVKSVNPSDMGRNDQRYVEFYDVRAAEEAYDRLRHQSLQDGVMDIALGWELDRSPRRRDDRHERDFDDAPRGRGRGSRGGRGGRGRGRGGYQGDDWDRRDDRDRDRGSRRYDDDYGRGGGGGRGGYNDRFDSSSRGGGYRSGPGGPPSSYGGGSGPSYGQQSSAPPPVDERLEQARKVQQLLAALKQPQGSGSPVTPQNSGPAPPNPSMMGMGPVPNGMNSYYAPPPSAMQQSHPPFPGSLPPLSTHTSSYPPMPQTTTPQPPPGGMPPMAALASLPPNILALIQSAQAQQSQQQQPPPGNPPMPQYNMAPQQMAGSPPPPMPGVPAGQPSYQQLMAYLTQAGKRS